MNRAIKDEDLTQSVCLFVSQYGTVLLGTSDGWKVSDPDYVQVSEPVDIAFVALPDEDVLKARVDCIDNQIETVRADLTCRVNDLLDQKQKLLAITHEQS